MIKIRKNVFETNSSSTHSLVMCSGDEWDLLEKNEAFLVSESTVVKKENLITEFIKAKDYRKKQWEEYCQKNNLDSTDYNVLANNIIKGYNPERDYDEEDFDDDEFLACFDKYDICTLDQFWEMYEDEYETYTDSYETKSGEKVMAFGYYGNDY